MNDFAIQLYQLDLRPSSFQRTTLKKPGERAVAMFECNVSVWNRTSLKIENPVK